MLKKFKLLYILPLGFGLLGVLILYIANLGYSSTQQLKETLNFITGDAWDTADGAMEGTIGVELQMLSIEHYLDDVNNEEAKAGIKEGQALEKEALTRMINANQISAEQVEPLNQARTAYRTASAHLIEAYQTFTELDTIRKQEYEALLFALDEIEELGDNFVGQYENRPNTAVTWNNGLSKAWTVADGMMEYRISILSRGSYYQTLRHSRNFDKYLPLVEAPWADIVEILKELRVANAYPIVAELRNKRMSAGQYKGQTFANTLVKASKTHKESFDAAIAALREVDAAYREYQTSSKQLLSMVETVEEAADGTVEDVINSVEPFYNSMKTNMIITVLITVLMAGIISIAIIRLILSQTNKAREIAQSIASGNLENQIDGNAKTEFGALMNELGKMQSSLKASNTQMVETLTKNKRIVDALDNASAQVIITDAKRQIVFANHNMNSYIKTNKDAFAQKVKDIANHDIKDPAIKLFEKLGVDLSKDQKQTLSLADKTIEINVQAIKSEKGDLIGFFTEWEDVTNTLAIQNDVKNLINQASKGNLEHRLKTDNLDGFLLELSTGINSMLSNIQNAVSEFVSTSEKLSKGDFSSQVDAKVEGDLKALKDALNTAISNVSQTLSDILQTSHVVRQSASTITNASTDVADQTSNNAASIEEIAASLEQMTASVQQSAEYTRQVHDSSNKTIAQAKTNSEIVEKSVAAMNSIQEVSQKIDGITNLIDSIAFQTNLLALNAAVEAARAGEHGRGFAVVAGEVRSLAGKSSDAAKEIKDLVVDVNEKVSSGSKLVESSSSGLADMIAEIQNVGEMIAEVSKSSVEQNAGISQINSAVTNFDSVTQQTAAKVGDTATTSQDMLRLMGELENKLKQFKLLNSSSTALTRK